jgi:hypothetical protein
MRGVDCGSLSCIPSSELSTVSHWMHKWVETGWANMKEKVFCELLVQQRGCMCEESAGARIVHALYA